MTIRALAAVVLLAAGCGGADPVPARHGAEAVQETGPPDPLVLLPSDTVGVLRIDMRRLRQSPYYPTVQGWVEQMEEVAAEQGRAGAGDAGDVLERTDLILVAATSAGPDGADPDVMVVARGSYREGELAAWAREGRAPDEPPLREEEWSGHAILTNDEASMAALGTHTWLVATGDRIVEMLSRADGGGGATPRSSDVFRAMAERIGFEQHDVTIVAEMTPHLREQLAEEARAATEQAFIESLVSFGLRLDVQDGIDGEAIAETTNPVVAAALVDEARRQLDRARGEMMVRVIGLGPVLDGTSVRVEGPTAYGTLRTDDAATRTLLARVESLVMLAIQALAAQGTGALDEGGLEMPVPPGDGPEPSGP